MKLTHPLTKATFAFALIVSAVSHSGSFAQAADPLAECFQAPPLEYHPETWFHVIGYNLGKEGLTKDLEAIKAAGIQGIHLFNRSGPDFPEVKPVIPLTPEWFSLIGHAANECQRLGLSLTLQNCGGWSMTGGPWVPIEEAQRELVQTTFHFKDGAFDGKIPATREHVKEDKNYQDVCVIAFPTPKGDDQPVLIPDDIESNNEKIPWGKILDPKSRVTIPVKGPAGAIKKNSDRNVGKVNGRDTYVQVRFKQPVTLRSISLPATSIVSDSKLVTDIDLILETVQNGKRTKVAVIPIPDGCWMDKQHDITLSVPEVTTRELRITFAGAQDAFLSHLHLLSLPRAHNWEAKAAFALRELMQDTAPHYSPECFIAPESIVDLTGKLSADQLNWTPPKGDWTIIRFGHVNMGSVNGPSPKELLGWETSKLDQLPLENHLRKGMVGQMNQPGGAVGDGKLHGLLADSWERMIPTWTMQAETLFNEFQKRRGYDLRRFMPAMAGYLIHDTVMTEKFLRDLRQTMDDLYLENFFRHFTTLANGMGAKSYIEGAVGEVLPGDALRYYGVADIPMTEFWYNKSTPSDDYLNYKPVKYAASAAHVYNKKRVAAEALTEGGSTWSEDFYCVKPLIDQHFALGVNHLVFHTFTHNPTEVFPGSTFGGTTGFPFVRNQTWWRHMPAFTDYISRCQFILQQGEYAADVLWYLGDEVERPPYQMSPFPKGYQYDHLNSEILQSTLAVQDGNLTIKDGGTYRVLWLRNSKKMVRATAEKIKALVMAGAVVLGDKPIDSPSLMDNAGDLAAMRALSEELWGNAASGMKKTGKGKIYWGQSIGEVLQAEAVAPDLIAPKKLNAYWHHRKTKDADLYFISSQNGKATDATIAFRITGQQPELWNPLTGERHPAKVWQVKDGATHVAISFDPHGSAIVVFRRPTRDGSITKIEKGNQIILSAEPGWCQEHAENHTNPLWVNSTQLTCWDAGDYQLTDSAGKSKMITAQADAQTLNDSWQVSFAAGWDAPESLRLDALIPLSQHENKAVRYYSGTVTYRKKVTLSDGKSQMLDLGKVGHIAEVWCNGQRVGTRWAPPFVFDLSAVVKNGSNELEIKVTNPWRNQLIYDDGRAKEKQKTWTSNPPKNQSESPQAFGLMGPVLIRSSVSQSFAP